MSRKENEIYKPIRRFLKLMLVTSITAITAFVALELLFGPALLDTTNLFTMLSGMKDYLGTMAAAAIISSIFSLGLSIYE